MMNEMRQGIYLVYEARLRTRGIRNGARVQVVGMEHGAQGTGHGALGSAQTAGQTYS